MRPPPPPPRLQLPRRLACVGYGALYCQPSNPLVNNSRWLSIHRQALTPYVPPFPSLPPSSPPPPHTHTHIQLWGRPDLGNWGRPRQSGARLNVCVVCVCVCVCVCVSERERGGWLPLASILRSLGLPDTTFRGSLCSFKGSSESILLRIWCLLSLLQLSYRFSSVR